MPCSDNGQSNQQSIHDRETISQLESMICALVGSIKRMAPNEVEFRKFINIATVTGQSPDILEWWVKHNQIDVDRLEHATKEFLKQFSEQEQAVIQQQFESRTGY